MSNPWLLVVVTLSGDISSSNYPNEGACRDALSIAQTGMTVAENRGAEAKLTEARAQWYMEHPPREPRTFGERAIAKVAGAGLNFDQAKYHVPYHIVDGGKIQDDPPPVASAAPKIKSGRCIPTEN